MIQDNLAKNLNILKYAVFCKSAINHNISIALPQLLFLVLFFNQITIIDETNFYGYHTEFIEYNFIMIILVLSIKLMYSILGYIISCAIFFSYKK